MDRGNKGELVSVMTRGIAILPMRGGAEVGGSAGGGGMNFVLLFYMFFSFPPHSYLPPSPYFIHFALLCLRRMRCSGE